MSYTRSSHYPGRGSQGYQPTHDVRLQTYERLRHQYGYDRAREIMAGTNTATQDDIDAWQSLGRENLPQPYPRYPQGAGQEPGHSIAHENPPVDSQ